MAYVVGESRGVRIAVSTRNPKEKAAFELGRQLFHYQAGPWDFSCASCHGVHNIFPSSDPRSTVNPKNLAATCGKCHAGAGTRFVIGPVHVSPASVTEKPLVKWIRVTYR